MSMPPCSFRDMCSYPVVTYASQTTRKFADAQTLSVVSERSHKGDGQLKAYISGSSTWTYACTLQLQLLTKTTRFTDSGATDCHVRCRLPFTLLVCFAIVTRRMRS